MIPQSLKNRRHRARYTAARKHRAKLVREQNGCCFWCSREIIEIALIPEHRILKRTAHHVHFVDDWQQVQQKLYATVDHLTPISHEINNTYDNLVASCQQCNNARTAQPRLPENLRCKKCGRSSGLRKHCRRCRHENKYQWLQKRLENRGIEIPIPSHSL